MANTYGTRINPGSFIEVPDPDNPGQTKRPDPGLTVYVRDADTGADLPPVVTDSYGYLPTFTVANATSIFLSTDPGWSNPIGPIASREAITAAIDAALTGGGGGQPGPAVDTLRSLLRPVTTLPVHPEPPTIGTMVDVTGKATTDLTGSTMAYPLAVPYYVGGVAANGENVRHFRSYGWARQPAGSGAGLAFGRSFHPSGFNAGGCPSSVEFIFDGPAFEFRLFAAYQDRVAFQIYVDDLPIADATVNIYGASLGHAYLIPVTFDTATTRKIRIEFDRFQGFGGLVINNDEFTVATGSGKRLQGYACADSYGDGAQGIGPLDTYAMQLGRLLGLDMYVDAQGGTGFVAPSGTGKTNYPGRIGPAANDPRLDPDIVILQVSTNDGNDATRAAQVGPAVTAQIAQVRSQWPKAKIFIPGLMLMMDPTALTATNVTNMVGARAAATASVGGADLFIDPFPGQTAAGQDVDGWYTGNSNTSATGDTGNTGRYRTTDNVHGNAAWHAMVSRTIAAQIWSFLGVQPLQVSAGGPAGGPGGDLTALDARVDALELPSILTQPATSYTFVAADAGRIVECTSSAATTITIPPASTPFLIGARIRIRQVGTGAVTLAAASGVTLQVRNGSTRLGGQWAEATLQKRASNTWLLTGDVVPSS